MMGREAEDCRRVVLFDGTCNLCNRWVGFVLRRDASARFRFCSLQSETGRRLLQELGRGGEQMNSVVLIQGRELFEKSSAALRIAGGLSTPWCAAEILLLVPRPFRDWVYDFIARNRYRWSGKSQMCFVPSSAYADRFLG